MDKYPLIFEEISQYKEKKDDENTQSGLKQSFSRGKENFKRFPISFLTDLVENHSFLKDVPDA